MATTLKLTRNFGWSGSFNNSGDTGQPGANMQISVAETQDYADGSSDNQGDVIIFKRDSAAAAADSHDLYDSLVDIYGNAVTLAKIRAIWVHNIETTSAKLLTLGGNIFNVLGNDNTDTPIVHPSGHWIQEAPIDGFTVTDAQDHILTLDPGANTVAYTLRIIGVKA